MRRTALTAILAFCITACAGPDRGWIAEARGRTQSRLDAQEAGKQPPGGIPDLPLFPFLYVESGDGWLALEKLWPLVEVGHGPVLPWGRPRWIRVRPFLWVDEFRGLSRTVVFPFYFRVLEELEAGDRSILHLWPFYGIHRETIDLAPAVTHHVAWPFFLVRHGPERWKVRLFPAFDGSHGYLDRGWWLLPVLKWGGHGQNEFFYLLDPLFAYERDSIAESAGDETPAKRRWSVRLLGGLAGWEDDRGRSRFQLLWWIKF